MEDNEYSDDYSGVESDAELCEILDEISVNPINLNNNSVKKKKIVNDADRITSNYVTKYELTRAITYRITQIERGSKYFTNIGDIKNPKQIAIKEVIDRKTPIIIEREIDIDEVNNISYCERWKLNEMAYPTNFIFL